jgi:cystathionine beta-lyase
MHDPFEELTEPQLRARTSLKWRRYPPDVLPVWVAEMDVLLAPPVRRELERLTAAGDTGYAYGDDYARALAAFAADRWAWELDVEATALLADVMRGATELLRLVTDPGDAVVVNPPVYPPFFEFVTGAGRRVVDAPLSPTGRLDLTVLDRAYTEATAGGVRRAAHLLCSPHNPTGTVHRRDELEAVAALAGRHGVRVVADEVHAPLVAADAAMVPYLTVAGADDAFAVHSASKAWNLAGAKAAVAVAGPAAAVELAGLSEEVRFGASHLGVRTHTVALRDGGDWLDAVVAGIDRRRGLATELLAEHVPGIVVQPSEATYLAWLDLRGTGLGDDPAAALLERGRVALTPGPPFGEGGAGHARLNLATSEALLSEAVRRMATATA